MDATLLGIFISAEEPILSLGNPNLLKGLLANLPNLFLEAEIMLSILVRKQISPLPPGATLSVFKDLLLCKHPWEDSLEQKLGRNLENLADAEENLVRLAYSYYLVHTSILNGKC